MKTIAIVTGASSGMGKEFVRQLDVMTDKLDEIWVIARRTDRLVELQNQMHHNIKVCSGDLTKDEDIQRIQRLLEEEKPRITLLVNASGMGVHGKVEELEQKVLTDTIDLNCRGLTAMTKICLPNMARGGRIIQLASSAGFVPQPKFAVYAASKAYVLSFSRALNAELASRKITVTAVCPGPVDTEFFLHDKGHGKQSAYKKMVMAKPEAVVKLALKDAAKRKEMSVYGMGIKGFGLLTKVVPHKLILAVMKKIL